MIRHVLPCLVALCGLLLSTLPLRADPSMIDARILTGWRAEDGRHVAALHLTMSDGWKTYWRAPGDAGVPPRFDWRGSDNLADFRVTWPTPRTIDQGGIRTIGYADTVTLPLTLTPERPDQPIRLSGTIELGVCKDICVPVTLTLSQELPQSDTRRDPRIVSAMAARPYTAQEAGVGAVRCTVSAMQGGLHLRAEVDLPRVGADEVAVIETANPEIWVAQAETQRRGGRLVAETELHHVEGRAFALDRSGLRITVIGDDRAVDIQGCPAG